MSDRIDVCQHALPENRVRSGWVADEFFTHKHNPGQNLPHINTLRPGPQTPIPNLNKPLKITKSIVRFPKDPAGRHCIAISMRLQTVEPEVEEL